MRSVNLLYGSGGDKWEVVTLSDNGGASPRESSDPRSESDGSACVGCESAPLVSVGA